MTDVEIGSPAPDLDLVGSDGTKRPLVGHHDGPVVVFMMRAWT